MVSLCVSLWKPCKDTWRTKSLQTAPQETLSHKTPSAFCRPELYFQHGGDLAWDYGRRLISLLPHQREPCTSGIISLVITCLTGRLREFNKIMFIKLSELLGRMNGAI